MHFTVLLLTLLLDRLRPVAPVESLLERLRHALALLARATWAGESHNPWLAVALVSAPVAALLLIARSALGGLGLLLDLIAMLLVVRLADVLQWAEYAARALDAVLGVERLDRFATDGRQPRYAFLATGRALVDVGLALRDGIGIRRAIRVTATGALGLRQRIQQALRQGCVGESRLLRRRRLAQS